jgi:hypothetical protein
MPWELLRKIVGDLVAVGFKGKLGLTNYNEPLLNPRLMAEIEYLRDALPQCSIRLYTNGDFLTRALVDDLAKNNVAFLRVSIYPRNDMTEVAPSRARIAGYIRRKALDELSWNYVDARQGLVATSVVGEMEFHLLSPDLRTFSSRGSTAKTVAPISDRQEPCFLTSHSATIDYRGRMKMCCCVFPESATHDEYIIGDLNTESFISLWTSPKLTALREFQARMDWSISPICAKCIHHSPPQPLAFEHLVRPSSLNCLTSSK